MIGNKPTLAIFALMAAGGCATSQQHVEPYGDIACFQRSNVSLVEAIEAAQHSRGQMVIDAEYNCSTELDSACGDLGMYRVTFFVEGRLSHVGVCPETGVVQPPTEKGLLRRIINLDFIFDWPETEMLRSGPTVAQAAVTMRDAIATAEATGGKAMAAHMKTDPSRRTYVIEIVEEGQMRIVSIDQQRGTIISQPLRGYRGFIARLINSG